MAVSDTLIDTLFDGRYRIIRRLGSGGMANVYLAEDQELGRRVAIKILNERHASDEQFIERFRREAKNAAALSHPNIVSIYDRGEAEGTYYIAMEHLDGRNLKELLQARGPAPVRIAVEYARQILGALRFAHRKGIVHRDIKPHNVLVDAEGRLKVTDFGIARAGAASQMTEAGSIVGTAQYLSPEQARGGAVDQRSDLYSVGIVLYELVTGKVPFSGDSPVEIAMKHLSAKPPLASETRKDIPRDLDLVVMRALAKDPDERYQSADEMDADLERVARGAAVSRETSDAATAVIAAPSSMPTAVTRLRTREQPEPAYAPPPAYYDYDERPRRRRPVWPWLLALLLIAAAGVAGVYVFNQIQDQLSESGSVAVPNVEGMRRVLATSQLREKGLAPNVKYEFSEDVAVGLVIDQDPNAGIRVDRDSTVNLTVSFGRERIAVPDVRGKSSTDAVAELTEAGLKPNVVQINSEQEPGTVTAQSPAPGKKVARDSAVRINVSKGPRPVAVPSVVGEPFETANSELQAAGFGVARRDVDSDQPKGTVVGQDPGGNTLATKGSSVTLSVSKGPKTSAVPDVTSLDRNTAAATLRSSGFKVGVSLQDTDDPSLANVVLSQNPAGGAQAKPGSTVTITVGRFVQPPPTTETVPSDTTETEPIP
jgi:beta-lactam-binding protein with PASTA domain/predicted Ser/Thr protein kinase